MSEGIQEGVKQGIQQSLCQGIRALVETCREFGASRRAAGKKVCEKYAISPKEAEAYVAQYW